MRIKLITNVFFVVSILGMMINPAIAQTDLGQRVIEMERQLKELKEIIRQQQQATEQVNAKVDQVAETKAVVAESGFKAKEGTKFSYGGYIKVNGIWDDASDGLTVENNITQSILVPGAIGTGDGSGGPDTTFNSDVFTSRFNFGTETQTDYGLVKSFIELDFLSGGGNEAVSNSTNPRIRHAFINWDYSPTSSILIGQAWGTFFNVGALPDSVDFIGPTAGAIFNRQQQIRWTKKLGGGSSVQLAAENPSSNLFGLGGDIDDSSIPDLVARYNGVSGGHSYSLAVVGRDVAVETTTDAGVIDDSSYGVAANIAGKYVLGSSDTLKYSLAFGNLGRYIALSAFGDGGIDDSGDVDLTSVVGGYIAYEHKWSPKFRSTFQYAYSTADLGDGVADTNTETLQNFNVSLVYRPAPKLDFGGAIIFADRELENGEDGDLTRFQLTAKYSF